MHRASKTERVVVRVSADDLARLDASAAAAGLCRSEYIRSFIGEEHLQVVRLDLDPAVLSSLLLELKRQGNNLNQLAMRANRNSAIDASEVSMALERCSSAAGRLAELIAATRPHR